MSVQVTNPGTISSARWRPRARSVPRSSTRPGRAVDESWPPAAGVAAPVAPAEATPADAAASTSPCEVPLPSPAATPPIVRSAVPAPRAASGSGTLGDRGDPVAVLREPPAHRVEVPVADQPADRAHLAGADRTVVDLDDRRDLDAGPAQQHLVGDVQLGAVDRAGLDGDPLVPEQLDDRLAGHALEQVVA